jgi:hypothetical protein
MSPYVIMGAVPLQQHLNPDLWSPATVRALTRENAGKLSNCDDFCGDP